MAYVSKEDKQRLLPGIKEVLNKYKMKGTVSVRNCSTLIVKVSKGVLDIMQNSWEYDCNHTEFRKEKPQYLDVYGIEGAEDGFTGNVHEFIRDLLAAMRGDQYFDKTNIQEDYFHCSHYYEIRIGDYKKPYELI